MKKHLAAITIQTSYRRYKIHKLDVPNTIKEKLIKSLKDGYLDLSFCDISADILIKILPLLSTLNITDLTLLLNNLGDAEATVLAKGLAKNTSLTTLDLCCNRIRPAGATALAKGLAKNTSLTHLNLGLNGLGTEGATALAKGIAKNKSLTTLNLNRNKIGPEGAKALADSLKINTSLTTIMITLNPLGNNLGDDLIKAIEKELEINKDIAKFKKEYKEQYMLKFLYLNKINSFMGQMVAEFIIDDFINPEAYQKLQTISERKPHQPNPLAAEEDPNPKTHKNKTKP